MSNEIKVKFIRNHEHAGKKYRHGDTITVSPAEANLFFGMKVAQKFLDTPAPKAAVVSESKGTD